MLDPSIDVAGSVLARAAVRGEAQRRSPWQPVEVNTGAYGPAQAGELSWNKEKGLLRGNSLSEVCTWTWQPPVLLILQGRRGPYW